MTAGHL